jgi:putative peptidoglycan lipid II flippase
MAMVLASRILGLIRDRMLSSLFTPDDLGVYFAAFRIPNLLFELIVMGALSSACVPVFTKYITQGKSDEAKKTASLLINAGVVMLLLVVVPFLLWTNQISRLLAPGFSERQLLTMSQYSQVLMAGQVIPLLIGNVFTGILQANQLFFIPAFAPVIYNIGIILGIWLFSSTSGLWAPVYGVVIGAILFLVIHIPVLLKIGYKHSWSLTTAHEGM